MRIAVDVSELGGQPTGVGRFLAETVLGWANLQDAQHHEFLFLASQPVSLPPTGSLSATLRVESGHRLWWEQVTLPRLARSAGADVLFAPGYSGPVTGRVPVVVMIHDVSFAAHPEWFRWREGLRRRLMTRAAAHRAARIITVSEFSRREIHEHLGIPADRITVIPHGVRPLPPPNGITSSPERREPLVLFVGSLFQRRHLPALMAGFAGVARRYSDARLSIVGDNRTFPAIDMALVRDEMGMADRIDLSSYVTEDALRLLYARAAVFAFLSEYEGFGMTPLEALAAGVPIVVLDTPVSREVYGAAALYVARPEPRLIERALDTALHDPVTRRRLLDAASGLLKRYSWDTCAARVLDVLTQPTD